MIQFRIFKPLLVLLVICLLVPFAMAQTQDQRIKIELREIGNEFLSQLGDDTSRVTSVSLEEGRYAVRFEREFFFEPDLLIFSVFRILEKKKSEETYIVEVEQCHSRELVHSFEADIKLKDGNIACKLRGLPEDCYVFYFTEVKNEASVNKITNRNEEEKSGWNYLVFSILGIIGIVAIVYFIKPKSPKNRNSDGLTIGSYQFDKKAMTLEREGEVTELSSKEVELLFLFITNENKTLERDYILNKVWGDEGNYVGRTLDVFVSKLRKKLEADTSLKIVNVRGVGYRFVMEGVL